MDSKEERTENASSVWAMERGWVVEKECGRGAAGCLDKLRLSSAQRNEGLRLADIVSASFLLRVAFLSRAMPVLLNIPPTSYSENPSKNPGQVALSGCLVVPNTRMANR